MPVDFSQRDPVSGVLPLLHERWSPRSFAPFEIDIATQTRLFDAARWSPSCFNAQPWRFYTSNADNFGEYLSLLNEKNQEWAQHASLIGFLIGKKLFEHNGKPNPTYALDCGSAWMAMTLQARHENLYTHGMAGILKDEIVDYFKLDTDKEEVMMGFAIGKIGDPQQLSEDMRAKETPSARKSLQDVWLTQS